MKCPTQKMKLMQTNASTHKQITSRMQRPTRKIQLMCNAMFYACASHARGGVADVGDGLEVFPLGN